MTSPVKSPLYKARSAGRAARVTVVVGDEYPNLVWRPHCVGCGEPTSRVDRRSGSVSRVEGRVRTTKTLTLPIPICSACSARDKKNQLLMLGGAVAIGLVIGGAAWPALGAGAAAAGIVGSVAAAAVAIAVGPAQSVGVSPTMGGQVTLVFRRRESARELIEANAADEREAKELVDELGA